MCNCVAEQLIGSAPDVFNMVRRRIMRQQGLGLPKATKDRKTKLGNIPKWDLGPWPDTGQRRQDVLGVGPALAVPVAAAALGVGVGFAQRQS